MFYLFLLSLMALGASVAFVAIRIMEWLVDGTTVSTAFMVSGFFGFASAITVALVVLAGVMVRGVLKVASHMSERDEPTSR